NMKATALHKEGAAFTWVCIKCTCAPSALELQVVGPFVDLAVRLIFGDAVAFLQLAGQLVTITGDLLQIVIGQFAPLDANVALQLLPLAFQLIPNATGHPHTSSYVCDNNTICVHLKVMLSAAALEWV